MIVDLISLNMFSMVCSDGKFKEIILFLKVQMLLISMQSDTI